MASCIQVLLVIHDEKSDQEISEMRHDYDKIINTHIHNKIDKDRCLEIFCTLWRLKRYKKYD